MRFRWLTVVLLVAALIPLTLAGCGSSSDNTNNTKNSGSVSQGANTNKSTNSTSNVASNTNKNASSSSSNSATAGTTAKAAFANAKVGSIVKFGSYEQDNNTSNGKEAIEWRVLAKEGGRVLAISSKVLDYQQFNESISDIAFGSTTLGKWLKGSFASEAGLKDSSIEVTLLSADMASSLFTDKSDRLASPTEYAKAVAAGKSGSSSWVKEGKGVSWWLSSKGNSGSTNIPRMAEVKADGSVDTTGTNISSKSGVRPAIWVSQ